MTVTVFLTKQKCLSIKGQRDWVALVKLFVIIHPIMGMIKDYSVKQTVTLKSSSSEA